MLSYKNSSTFKLNSLLTLQFKQGVSVPKKSFKSAVKRNRIKRLLRESYRLNKAEVFNNSEGTFAFLFLYLGKEIPSYQKVETQMKEVLEKFTKKISYE